ncbi:two-component system, chemotaxis family, CheB/CheR fusion protein [Luteibacter sp. UNCMF331Sha3.1]|uniref:CheR family methyltransferase n=1 Tax=Luteibacter sp. UNCMF331Sha3.1 TaxID=1502760 RepID=UPI0008BBF837|nr:CheR family methyltransferase [Luteibacter sp. UNCMF331Sha3.1]SEM59684.1 two-component system, chemotaxis family, CheB/CheR fusion protein [Luteibacter sp. UNCMF331Sha3.1]
MSDLPPTDPEADPNIQVSTLDFPVVGLGTSAGGLAALGQFFESMPPNPGMAFVIVMHLSPEHDSIADRILQRSTSMRVVQVNEAVALRKNEIYVISPRKALSMSDGHLRLTDLPPRAGKHVAIDYFFRTLAEVHRERAIAVILTGTGSDGSIGIARIKERGGITLAQHPDDAEYSQMPLSAIATGAVDIVLPLSDLPERILALTSEAARIAIPEDALADADADGMPVAATASQIDEAALHEIMLILRTKTGHDFRSYKRATVLRRIERRMQVNGLSALGAYRDYLKEHSHERPALLKDMLISVTNFFRDRDAFDALERTVIPQLFETLDESDRVRAWCAGCATGEEAYSIAMLLSEAAAPKNVGVQVFGTDIDEEAIAYARRACYPPAVVTDIIPARVNAFFVREEKVYRLTKALRERVMFARHNVIQDPPFSKLDLITCRNLLIYLNRDVQAHVLEMFHFALKPGGYLFLGSSESAEVSSKYFSPVDKKNRIYRATPGARSGHYLQGPTRHVPSTIPTGVVQQESAADRSNRDLAEIHRKAVEEQFPASILVDREGHIAHMSGRAGDFLRLAGGAPSYQITGLIAPELRLELRTAMFRASHGAEPVRSGAVAWHRNGQPGTVSIEVIPVVAPPGDGYQLVVFREGDPTERPAGESADHEQTPLLLQLEEELRRTKEQLQATIEESETSSEELKASNEELQSINEELRSATEELETSKEELQSVNEELITVNHELKQKVDETAKVNDDLQNLVTSTDIATVFVDQDMCIKRFTPRAADIFRLIAADVGRSLLDLNHSLDYPDLAGDATQAFQFLRTIEREIGGRDGRWYIARILPYRTSEDRIEGAVLTFIDITRRRAAEEAARSSEERMRLVADSATDYAFITTTAEGMITSWSRGAERIFGYSSIDAIGRGADVIFPPEDRASGAFHREMERALSEGRASEDCWYLRANGERIFCSGITVPLSQGNASGFVKVLRDVTLSKHRDNAREDLLSAETASRQQAQSANDLKDEFLAVMSHELKHPLNLILMNAELIARSAGAAADDTMRTAAEAISRTVEGQAQIIDDLLDLSRVNTGKLTLNIGPVNVTECIRRIAASMGDMLAKRRMELHLRLPGTDLVISADATRVEQVIWNLLSNAVKFGRDGGSIAVSLSVEPDHATLQVRDNGVGMSPELAGRVFTMFEQGERGAQSGGLGIGLALVRELVEMHGGTVEAASDGLGKGSLFTVTIPRRAVTPVEDEKTETIPAASTVLRGRHILIVDDSLELLQPFSQLLTAEGATATAVSSGEEALALIGEGSFDTLLSDIGMPGMDGHDLIRNVRANPATAHILAIALTGFGRLADQRKALDAGFDAHLSKPVSMRSLTSALSKLIDAAGRPDPAD